MAASCYDRKISWNIDDNDPVVAPTREGLRIEARLMTVGRRLLRAQQDVLHSEGLRSSTLPVYVLMISS